MAVTTVASVQQVVRELEDYMAKCGGLPRDWYVGVAADPRARLFRHHNASEQQGAWIYRELRTDDESRQVERYFLAKGCEGGDGGGDWQSKFAYLYRKASYTNP